MEGTDNNPTLDDLRRAALVAYEAGCEQFGPAFGKFGLTSSPAIIEYADALGGNAEAALAGLRSSHESNCKRPHAFDEADADPAGLARALEGLRAQE